MGVAGGDAAFAQFVQHGGVVDAEVVTDSGQRPAEVVQVDGVVDLVGREAAAAHGHAVPVEDGADRSPFDAEPVTELVHRRAGPVVGDQLLDLIGTELPSTARPVALDQAWLGGIEAGELLPELFQGPDLVFYVRVRSPNLHSGSRGGVSAESADLPPLVFCMWGATPTPPRWGLRPHAPVAWVFLVWWLPSQRALGGVRGRVRAGAEACQGWL